MGDRGEHKKDDGPWWFDPRCHCGELGLEDLLSDERRELRPAIDFLCTETGVSAGGAILGLCCGPGRYSVELAKRGFAVVGIDINAGYIELAQRLAEHEGVQVEFAVGDMREISFRARFDLAINVGTSFGFFEDEADDMRVLAGVARSLEPGGVFVLETGNRDYLLNNFVHKDWVRLANGTIRLLEREFDPASGRINTRFEVAGTGESWAHSWRAYTLAEVRTMLCSAGLEPFSVAGDWRSSAYGTDSPRMVVLSRKAVCDAGTSAPDG